MNNLHFTNPPYDIRATLFPSWKQGDSVVSERRKRPKSIPESLIDSVVWDFPLAYCDYQNNEKEESFLQDYTQKQDWKPVEESRLEPKDFFTDINENLIQANLDAISSEEKKAIYEKIFEPIRQLLEPVYFTEDDPYKEMTASVYAGAVCAGYAIYLLSEMRLNTPIPFTVYRKDGRVDITLENLQKTVRLRIGKWGEPVLIFHKKAGESYQKDEVALASLFDKLSFYFG